MNNPVMNPSAPRPRHDRRPPLSSGATEGPATGAGGRAVEVRTEDIDPGRLQRGPEPINDQADALF